MNQELAMLLSMLGMPFVGVLQRVSVNRPVLGEEADRRTGLALWVSFEFYIPAGRSLHPDDQEFLDMINQEGDDDFFFALTKGDGGNGSGPHRTSEINARLAALRQGPISSPAICVDKSLRN